MSKFSLTFLFTVFTLVSVFAFTFAARSQDGEQKAGASLTVNVAKPEVSQWSVTIPASGRLAAWHEATIAAEVSGMKIIDIKADVGSYVKKGDLLVQFAPETAQAALEQQQAAVEKAEADLDQAKSDADSARGLRDSGALSKQKTTEYLIAERKAKATVFSEKAALETAQLTLDRTKVYAPDDGVISARSASLGKVVNTGDELFKLIRQNRIEWQAELPIKGLFEVKEGTKARIPTPVGDVSGEVRLVSPTTVVDNGRVIVYVSLHPDEGMPQPKAGILVSGYFEFDPTNALTVPATAVILKDGFSYVFVLNEADHQTVTRKKVQVGRRQNDRIEIVSGIDKAEEIVTSGGSFLADGSVVRVSNDNDAAKKE